MKAAKALLLASLATLGFVLSASLIGLDFILQGEANAQTEMEYRTTFVPAPIVEEEGDTGWKQIDHKEFSVDLRLALNKLAYEGFEVLEVIPITRGRLETRGARHGSWGGGYGVTQGLMIIARKTRE